ncbi:hypothetical protein AB3S75_021713 [Citrus x aurantiifolia]
MLKNPKSLFDRNSKGGFILVQQYAANGLRPMNEILLRVPAKTYYNNFVGPHDNKLVRSRLDDGPSSSSSKN